MVFSPFWIVGKSNYIDFSLTSFLESHKSNSIYERKVWNELATGKSFLLFSRLASIGL